MKRGRKNRIQRRLKWVFILISVSTAAYLSYLHFSDRNPSAITLRELPEGFNSHGIDISHYQNEIDWEVLEESLDSAISFVYYKSTEGTRFVDPLAEEYSNNLSALNVEHGAYHFFTPSVSAEKQARHFLKNTSSSNTLPPVLDAETEGETDRKLIEGMQSWLRIVENQSGTKPIIYTSYHFYKTKFRGKFDGYEFWIASYSRKEFRLKDDCIIHWQYSDKGAVPGIEGFVDLNFSKKIYN